MRLFISRRKMGSTDARKKREYNSFKQEKRNGD
jgi:hypothetical protein